MSGGTPSASSLFARVGITGSAALSLAKLFAETHRQNSNSFKFPFRRLAACLQLAEREKSKWKQSSQEQSERGGFRDGSASTASISTSPASATSPAVQSADAGRAGVGDGVVAGKGNLTS